MIAVGFAIVRVGQYRRDKHREATGREIINEWFQWLNERLEDVQSFHQGSIGDTAFPEVQTPQQKGAATRRLRPMRALTPKVSDFGVLKASLC